MKYVSMLCLLVAIPLAAPAHAQSLDELFRRADGDRDGRISRSEMEADARTLFRGIDGNGDGILSFEEFYADNAKTFNETGHVPTSDVVGEVTRQAIRRWDRNGDGRLSAEEYVDGTVSDTFQFADANGDGYLTREEMREFRGED